jgi:hypothetical protein
MSFKKLITISDEDWDFIKENEFRNKIKPGVFILTAISFYISHLKEVRAMLKERRNKQFIEEIKNETIKNLKK